MISKVFYFDEDDINAIKEKIPVKDEACNAIDCGQISCDECPIGKFAERQAKSISELVEDLKKFKKKIR